MMWSLIALSIALSGTSSTPVRSAAFQPTSTVTAKAQVSVTVLRGVRFGKSTDYRQGGAHRKSARLADASGQLRPAQLLEFE